MWTPTNFDTDGFGSSCAFRVDVGMLYLFSDCLCYLCEFGVQVHRIGRVIREEIRGRRPWLDGECLSEIPM